MYGFGYGFGGHARYRAAAAGGGAPPAQSSQITMPGTVWAFGASSMAGAQQAASSSGGTEDSLTNVVRAIEGLGAGSLAFTTVGGSQTTRPIDYNLAGVNASHKICNRGVPSQTSGSGGTIVSTMSTASASFGAGDFMVMQQGDNGLTTSSANPVETLAGGFAAMRALAGARGYIQIVNTRDLTEYTGARFSYTKAATLRVLNDLNPGTAFSFAGTLLDYAVAADANDTADLGNAIGPRSYMMNDGSHQIAKGYNLQSDAVLTPVIDAWAGGTPFPLKQIVEAAQPAVPAAGDVIGSIVAYGSGGSFSLDPSNTQTDYAISASGQITRIGATPPARDVTWMKVKCSKTGRFDKVQPRIGVCERAAAGVSKLVEFDAFSAVGMPDCKLANSAKLTILFRLQSVDQSIIQFVMGGTGAQGTIQINTAGTITFNWCNAGGTTIFAKTSAANFRTVDGPRWVAMCLDLSNPAAELTSLATWIDPATATTDTALHANLTADTTTAHLARLDLGIAIGYNTPVAPAAATFRKFRIGDFILWRDYIDFTVQARREEVANADGTPKTAWVSGGGVTDGKTPNIRLAGNAGDWRQARLTGLDVPATPGASGQYMAHVAKLRGDGEPGYLVTV